MITHGNKRLGHQKTILSLHALFCGKVSKLNNQRSSTLWNDACNFRRNRTCFNKPVHVLFTCKLQFFCAALLTFKIKINPVFSKPLFFESPVNSNQMQFPSPQSKTLTSSLTSRTGRVFQPIFICLGRWKYRDFTVSVNFALLDVWNRLWTDPKIILIGLLPRGYHEVFFHK